jgi:GAF domain-containing protein
VNGGAHEQVAALRARNEQIRGQVAGLRNYLDSLQTLLEALDQERDNEHILAALAASLEHALSATDAAGAMLLVLDEDTQELVSVLVHGLADAEQRTWQRVPADAGFAGWALRHAKALIANDARSDERYCESLEHECGMAVNSLLVVPVIGRERVLGVFQFLNKSERGMFGDDDQTLVTLMSRFAGELLHRMSR